MFNSKTSFADADQKSFENNSEFNKLSPEMKQKVMSMYKFKINFSDLMEQIKKNDPNAGRHPDQDEIDEKKDKIGPTLKSNLD